MEIWLQRAKYCEDKVRRAFLLPPARAFRATRPVVRSQLEVAVEDPIKRYERLMTFVQWWQRRHEAEGVAPMQCDDPPAIVEEPKAMDLVDDVEPAAAPAAEAARPLDEAAKEQGGAEAGEAMDVENELAGEAIVPGGDDAGNGAAAAPCLLYTSDAADE